MLLECLFAAVAVVLGAWALGARGRRAVALVVSMALAAVTAAVFTSRVPEPPAAPVETRSGDGFVTSTACRSCHAAEYSSWHASFHRSMTQPASVANSAAKELLRGTRLRTEASGRTIELFARDERLWAAMPDPQLTSGAAVDAYEATFRSAPTRNVPVLMLTGSHHHQAFWVAGARAGELRALPAVYLIDEKKLIARRDAFLNPPDAAEHAVRWNSNCVQCHAVAGAPAHDEPSDTFRTSAAELGIACEACHGAAEEHVRRMQNPLTRYRARQGATNPLGIVNPAKLAPTRGSEVCGRCHSYFFPRDEADWWENGFSKSYRPGDDLSQSQRLLSPEVLGADDAPALAADTDSLFYADGTIRVGGREYNGLVRSPCYERGEGERRLTCFSCHSLHRGAPSDQLAPEKLGNEACLSCHEDKRARLTAHTRHAPASAGSLCYNCHMPHTTYALLGAIRSHRVDSPTFDERTRDRPNACNLCHLEQSEAWAAQHTASWFGSRPRLILKGRPPGNAELAAGAVLALTGDAAVRAITAAALGRHESSTPALDLRRQLLETLSSDDYAAVRAIAARALRALPAASNARQPLDPAVVERLLDGRDRRPVTIAE